MAEILPSVYLETTIPSYLAAWPSRDLILATHQQITRDWWRDAAQSYKLVVSQTVLDEASQGDPTAVAERMRMLHGISVLTPDTLVARIAGDYRTVLALSPKAYNDAVHLAYAVVFELDYLVTWNMRHLANSLTMRRITEHNLGRGLHVPLIVTPEYLLASRGEQP